MPKPINSSISTQEKSKLKSSLTERDKHASQTLATRYDALNEQFIAAETRLKALKPLHPVWVEYDIKYTEDSNPSASWDLLGFTKLDGKWRLTHAYDNEFNDGSPFFEIKAITECPIQIRVRAAKEVRKLHNAIIAQKEKFIPEVEEAINELAAYCTEI